MKRHRWNSLNVCRSHQRWTPQYMFHPLVTEVILLRLSLGLRPLIRENVSSLWQPVTHRVKKGTISSIFSTAVLWVRVQASVCLCVMTVSCDVAMTTDYAQRDRLEREISLRLRKAVQDGARPGACKCQFFEGRETEERWFMLKIKSGPTATGQNSVISSTGPLIISAQPITALWNTSAWREVRPETVTSLQPPTIIGWKKEAAPSACKAPPPPMVEWDAVVHREILRHGCYLMLAISYLVIVELNLRTPIHTQLTGHWTLWLKHKRTLCSQQRNLVLTVYT